MTTRPDDLDRFEDKHPEYDNPSGHLTRGQKPCAKAAQQPERDIDHEIRMRTDSIYADIWQQIGAITNVRKNKASRTSKRMRKIEEPSKRMLFALDLAGYLLNVDKDYFRWTEDLADLKSLLTGEPYDPQFGNSLPKAPSLRGRKRRH